jgi:hypothetical protein
MVLFTEKETLKGGLRCSSPRWAAGRKRSPEAILLSQPSLTFSLHCIFPFFFGLASHGESRTSATFSRSANTVASKYSSIPHYRIEHLRVQPNYWLHKNLDIPKRPLSAQRGSENQIEMKKAEKRAQKNLKR